jgi:hypothetical protein
MIIIHRLNKFLTNLQSEHSLHRSNSAEQT